jgi:hypothetical protein
VMMVSGDQHFDYQVEGLLLQSTERRGEYRHLGVFEMGDQQRPPAENMVKILNELPALEDAKSYSEVRVSGYERLRLCYHTYLS